MKNFIKTATAITCLALLPAPAESACTLKNLQGRYVAMIAGEFSGLWQRCNLRLDSNGRATGSCLDGTGAVFPADPVQFSLTGNCRLSGQSDNGFNNFFLRVEKHKRGATGRFEFDNGIDFFEGPVVAVKRGK